MSDNTMPAGQLAVLLHFYVYPPDVRFHNPAANFEQMTDELVGLGLIDYHPDRTEFTHNVFTITERGQVYVQGLLRAPLPIQKWVMP